jgi:glyoxylase-like metal-dependent hydrolase (beta-lactamase superfamily II)
MLSVHHINCGTMCPVGGRLMDDETPGLGPATLVCHCLVIETDHGLVLVDTGFGTRDVLHPYPRLSPLFAGILRPRFDLGETARVQLARRGYHPADVRHIVLTHLDFDHAGGLEDFPRAEVHVMEDELTAARRRPGPVAHGRYRPDQWDEGVRWRTYQPQGESWFGFPCVRELGGLPPEILLVPLVGHTPGHAGVAVHTHDGWLLHAGDAYFFRSEVDPRKPGCPAGLRGYQTLMETDRAARLGNQARLRELVASHADEVRVACAHDATELAMHQMIARSRPRRLPVAEADTESMARV